MRPPVLPEACQPPDTWRIIDGPGETEKESVLLYVATWAPEAFEAALLRQQRVRDRLEAAPPGRGCAVSGNRLARATAAAVLLVASIAAVVSFVHIQRLAVTHGQAALTAYLLQVSVDGTVAAASLVMLRPRAPLPVQTRAAASVKQPGGRPARFTLDRFAANCPSLHAATAQVAGPFTRILVARSASPAALADR